MQQTFSLTINERFKLNGGFIGVIEWVFGHRDQQWIGLFTRTVMETANTYTAAQKMLSKAPLVSPVYFILAGTKPYQVNMNTLHNIPAFKQLRLSESKPG